MKRLAKWLLAGAAIPGCTCRGTPPGTSPPATVAPTPVEMDAAAAPARPVMLDFVRGLDGCTLGHRGVLIDYGDPSARDDLHPGSVGRSADEIVEHEGATWLRTRARSVTASFYWPENAGENPEASVYVELRLRGVNARSATVAVDGKTFGSVSLSRSEPRVVVVHPQVPVGLPPGSHELTLRFSGGPRFSDEPLAEIDWAHVGSGDSSDPYAAPTRADVLIDATVGGRSLRALSLRAPGFVRCAGFIPSDGTIEASLATVGGGDADVEARLLRDRHAPVILGTAHVVSGSTSWAPWSVPITGLEGDGALGSIQLVVKRATKGTRVLLGEPRTLVAGASVLPPPPAARNLLVVVLGTTAAKSLAPWGGPHAAPELSRLASAATTFASHRASSSLASAVLASMLTGLPSRAHGLDDADARLPKGPTTIEEACRQGGVRTAMFTANPTTGTAFGFDRGWDTFVLHDPLENVPATTVFDDAATWIDGHKSERFLVVVHARGGHPPWEATPDELKAMPPEGYLGILEPQRAAEALAKARKHAGRFKEDDRARAWALHDHALDAHDAALGKLLAALRAAGHEDDTAVIVTSDVAPSEAPPVPLIDADTLEEGLLGTPLVVKWPGGGPLAGRRVTAPTSPVDVAKTGLAALGLLPLPEGFRGEDLANLARGALSPSTRPLAATRGARFSIRWGQYLLLGSRDREVRMCDLSLDAACVADVRATTPLALEPIHRWAVDSLVPIAPPFPREPAVLDEHTTAALVRWGRPADERETEDER